MAAGGQRREVQVNGKRHRVSLCFCAGQELGVLCSLPSPVSTVALEHWPSGRTGLCGMCYFKGAGGSL